MTWEAFESIINLHFQVSGWVNMKRFMKFKKVYVNPPSSPNNPNNPVNWILAIRFGVKFYCQDKANFVAMVKVSCWLSCDTDSCTFLTHIWHLMHNVLMYFVITLWKISKSSELMWLSMADLKSVNELDVFS